MKMRLKLWKRIAFVGAIALAFAGGLTALIIFVGVPAIEYSKANSLQDNGDIASAYDAFDRMSDYRDADERKVQLQADIINSRSAETMDFGGYSWLVLAERDGKTLLVLKDVLDPRPYNEALVDTSWESCTLRAYLNSAFYGSFEEADRARIAETAVINSDNAENGTKAGNDTKDHIFLLSLAEAKLYFPTDASRIARNSRGAAAWWWLRSPGMEPILAATVGSDGKLGYAGSGVNYTTRGVRPAMWVTVG
jgi:hypothetical protein